VTQEFFNIARHANERGQARTQKYVTDD